MPWGPHINQMYGEMDEPRRLGHFIMALDIERFIPQETFRRNLGEMLEELTAMEPAAGFERVCYPGQIEGMRRAQRRVDGIPLDPGLAEELAGLGRRFDLPFPA